MPNVVWCCLVCFILMLEYHRIYFWFLYVDHHWKSLHCSHSSIACIVHTVLWPALFTQFYSLRCSLISVSVADIHSSSSWSNGDIKRAHTSVQQPSQCTQHTQRSFIYQRPFYWKTSLHKFGEYHIWLYMQRFKCLYSRLNHLTLSVCVVDSFPI